MILMMIELLKPKEFVESMSAAPTSDLAFKRNRTSPEEIREYKKSRSGSDGGDSSKSC